MRILIATASKHGATEEIGQAIADQLGERGHDADVVTPEQVQDLSGYDAVVLGSAVYAGHWLRSALDLVDRHGDQLAQRPVWLFSSGPIGDPPEPDEDPVDVADVSVVTEARGHRLFAGRLDRSRLGFGERALVAALRAPEGDFRNWDAIGAWADEIAEELAVQPG